MKKVRELKSRAISRVKRFLGSDEEPTRPSTPVPANHSNLTLPVVNQPSSHLPTDHSPIAVPAPLLAQEAPIGHTLASSPDQALAIAPVLNRPSTPNPVLDVAEPPAVDPTTLIHSPETIPAQDAAPASSTTANPEDVAPPSMDKPSVDAPSAPEKAPASSGSDIWACIKSEGWANLTASLDILAEAASGSGLGPVKEVVEGLVSYVGICKDSSESRKDYEELRVQLEGIAKDLKQFISSSPAITTSVESICGSIRKEIEYLKTQRSLPSIGRLQKAETNAESIMNCHRRIQDHLQRLSRNANISIWKIVDELATENRLKQLAPSMWPRYNSEKALALGRRACTGGTRTSVLAQMHEWVGGKDTGNVYWINGMAGTGKTTIAYSLCEQLDTETNRLLCASFFCSRTLKECRDVGRIIPSIAYQLARASQPFRYALSQATERNPDAHGQLPHLQFDALIVQPLSNERVREAMPANMVVVIDALDECEDTKSTEQILDVLLTKSERLPIKFVVSSRPEPAIRDRMDKKDG